MKALNQENITLIGHGKMAHGLSDLLLGTHPQISVITKSDRHKEFKNNDISYTQLDITKDLISDSLISKTTTFLYLLTPLDPKDVANFFLQIPTDKKIIFISSTGVYKKNQGVLNEDNGILDNETKLFHTENFLRLRFPNLVILRPAGLYGNTRHPVKILSGRTNIKGAKELTHLVSHQNVQESIMSVLDKKIINGTFNIVSDLRITKKDYYETMAKKLKLALPVYADEEEKEFYNNISNEKSKNILGIKYQNPLDYC